MEKNISLLKFKTGEIVWGIDPCFVEEVMSVSSYKRNLFPILDFMKMWSIPGEKLPYKKIIFLKLPKSDEKLGILAHEVEDIEEIPLDSLKKLPPIVQKKILLDCVLGVSILAESFCILLDCKKLVS